MLDIYAPTFNPILKLGGCMVKKFKIILICLFCLFLITEVQAESPLNAEERAWLKEHGTIKVGVFDLYPPFGFIGGSGEVQGMSIDFWRLLSSNLNFWVQFYPAQFNNQLEGLKNGKYDSLAGIFSLKERLEFFDFSKPYTTILTNIYMKPGISNVKELKDLKELRTTVVEGDSGQVIAINAGLKPLSVATYREAVFDLANGATDAIIMDELVVAYLAEQNDLRDKIIKIGQPVDKGKMTLPVKKGTTILLNILNKGIDMISKHEWKEIEERWLGKETKNIRKSK